MFNTNLGVMLDQERYSGLLLSFITYLGNS